MSLYCHFFRNTVIAIACCLPVLSSAQLVGTEHFLKGDYVEVGIATNGAFGTGGAALPGATYSWTGPDGFSSSLHNPGFKMKEVSAGVYTMVMKKDGCTHKPSVTDLLLAPTPRHQDIKTQQLCEGTELKIDIVKEPGNSYDWKGPGIELYDKDLVVQDIRLSGSGYYYLTATSNEGCVTLDSILVKVDKRLTAAFGDDVSVCSGDSVQLYVQSDGSSVSWKPEEGLDNAGSLHLRHLLQARPLIL